MAFNAFVGGIEPGGLTNDFEVKILVCFLLENIARPLTFDELSEIFQNTGLVNYFEFAEAVSDLEKTGHIRREKSEDGTEQLALTGVGSVTAQTFQKTLPLSVREKTIETAQQFLQTEKCMEEVEITYAPVPDGYILKLVMRDIGSDLLEMKVFLPTEEECLLLKERIVEDPALFYSRMLLTMMGEEI